MVDIELEMTRRQRQKNCVEMLNPPRSVADASGRLTMHDTWANFRLWKYIFAEALPGTKQSLQLPLPADVALDYTCWRDASSTVMISGPAAATALPINITLIDAELTRKLRAECSSRGISLDSLLLASLFLAAAQANLIEQKRAAQPASIRYQRSLILGTICVVMALLSGSVESKLLRYFCSFYAVFAGAWAANIAIMEPPGFTIIVSTTAVVKAGEGASGVNFTPVRMSVSCMNDVWDIAEKHSREAEGMGVTMSGFARWKMRTWGVKGRRKRVRRTADMDPSPRPPAFQLFGCIRLEGSADGTSTCVMQQMGSPTANDARSVGCLACSGMLSSAPSPAEALGLRRTLPLGFDETPENVGVENVPDAAALLLIVLDARYTLVYRERRGAGATSGTPCEAVASSEGPSNSSAPDDSVGGLELTVVEGKRALSGEGAKWLLGRARDILVNSCTDPRHSTEAGDSGDS